MGTAITLIIIVLLFGTIFKISVGLIKLMLSLIGIIFLISLIPLVLFLILPLICIIFGLKLIFH